MAGGQFNAHVHKKSFLCKAMIWYRSTFAGPGGNPFNRLPAQIRRKFKEAPGFGKDHIQECVEKEKNQ